VYTSLVVAGAGQVSLRGLEQHSQVGTSWRLLELVPPLHAHLPVTPTEWEQQQHFVSWEGALATSPVETPGGAGGGGRGGNINCGGPKDQGGRNSHHEYHVPPSERLGVVMTLIQAPSVWRRQT